MRVLLADDHRLLVEGLSNLLAAHGIEVVATASDGFEAVTRTRVHRPDVVLMDVRMPRCDGLAATRHIKAELPATRVVMLTTSDDDADLFDAIRSGACGYLLKSTSGEELVEALRGLTEGVPPLSPGLAVRLLAELARTAGPRPSTGPDTRAADAPDGITERQAEVLALVADGLTYKEVGQRLGLSERTVRYHMSEIMDRLHLEHRSQVLAYAGRMGLGSPPE